MVHNVVEGAEVEVVVFSSQISAIGATCNCADAITCPIWVQLIKANIREKSNACFAL